MVSNRIHILLIEDDDDHALLIKTALAGNDYTYRMDRARDGAEALDYLNKRGSFTEAHRPDLILLDLKLPKIDGHQVLSIIKRSDELKMIPVIVLSTSGSSMDREKAYNNFANSYLVKPMDFNKFQQMIIDFKRYWFNWNMMFA